MLGQSGWDAPEEGLQNSDQAESLRGVMVLEMKSSVCDRLIRSTGDLVWGLVFASLLTITAISVTSVGIFKTSEQTRMVPTKSSREAKLNEWREAGIQASCGDAVVKVMQAEVGPIQYRTLEGIQFQSAEEFLKVKISIQNRSRVKKYSYLSVGLYDGAEDLLHDEYGNEYPIYSTGTVNIVGQLNYADLYPGQSVEDLIVFARPVRSATQLKLRLSGSGITGGEPLYFQFPTPCDSKIEFSEF